TLPRSSAPPRWPVPLFCALPSPSHHLACTSAPPHISSPPTRSCWSSSPLPLPPTPSGTLPRSSAPPRSLVPLSCALPSPSDRLACTSAPRRTSVSLKCTPSSALRPAPRGQHY